ncbi:dihydrolipoamide acetyltransferase family protein [Marinoscillum sp. MHG1-6]|uniref:dihydrolipoamide acetyltransferase family protein n=1 Tax=Marinoscillum sp. MHG1-6 TaxID=2959627 RepID=UPI002158630D|nr:dihydrolipoamide acetyltransferase family protein [Marinoscillum sp. MHG1-6]
MALVELVMPKMGESVMEGTILTWLKSAGDTVEEDESVLEVATDKVDTEIPSIYGGTLKEILVKEGDVVQVGSPIAIIEVDGEVASSESAPEEEENTVILEAEKLVEEAISAHGTAPATSQSEEVDATRFYSPLVKNIAKQENISLQELESVPGTGQEGRVTKNDILAYVEKKKSNGQAPAPAVTKAVPVVPSGEDEIIEMDRMRKMIAERMLDSRRTSAHVTSFVEADVTEMVKWRGKMKHQFMEKDGQALTYTPIILEAVVKAIKDYPMINIQIDGSRIIKKAAINIGLAVALPNGNLIVPVIKNADQLSILGLTKQVNDLAKRARENKLSADELQGGTFTVSNVGSFGNVMGTPIIVQPQVGILALGTIQKKPAVIETPQGDFIGIRHKMFLSHSYDHRVVDGALGGMFVRRVADYLEKFDVNRNV